MLSVETPIAPEILLDKIDLAVLEKSMPYEAYIENVNALIAQGKSSTNDDLNDEEHLHFTQLNLTRMKRLDKTTHLSVSTINALSKWALPVYFLVISEGWCGDASQILPAVHKIAEANSQIKVRVIYREAHLDIMNRYLTNGARAIPMVLIVSQRDGSVLGKYGPRPDAVAQLMTARKILEKQLPAEEQKAFFAESKTLAQKWYNDNKTIDIQNGLMAALEKIK